MEIVCVELTPVLRVHRVAKNAFSFVMPVCPQVSLRLLQSVFLLNLMLGTFYVNLPRESEFDESQAKLSDTLREYLNM